MTTLTALILGLGLVFQTQAADQTEQLEPQSAGEEVTEQAAAAEAEVEEVAEAEEVEEVAEAEEVEEVAEAEIDEGAAETVETPVAPEVTIDPVVEAVAAPTPEEEVAVDALADADEEIAEAVDPEDADEDGEEDAGPGKAWSVNVGNTIGFGLQIDEATSYYFGQLSVGGGYRIHGPIRASANVGLYYTWDRLPNDARRLDMGGASVGISHGKIFHDESYTGVRMSGSATVALPISMGGRARGNYPTVGAGISLARSVGPVNLSYGLTFNKFNPKAQVTYLPLCAEDRGAVDYCIGAYETNWQMGHRISASYSPIDKLSLSANFGSTLTRTYGPSSHDPAMTPDYMHDVRANIRDGFGFGLSASYQVLDSLSASLSFSNGGPWRSNGQDIYNPVFDPRLAAMSVGVSYSY